MSKFVEESVEINFFMIFGGWCASINGHRTVQTVHFPVLFKHFNNYAN